MNPELSIIIPTYNRIELLKELLFNVQKELTDINYEIIVSDNASSDSTESFFLENIDKRIKYFRNEQNLGFYKNFLNGLQKARSDIVWVCSDDDNIGERSFFEEGIKLIKDKKADLVFGRLLTRASSLANPDLVDLYPFKNEYTSKEYMNDWINIRERISSACFLYKKELFIEAHLEFLDKPFHGGTIDYALHYHVIRNSHKIKFLDKVAYIWTISQNEKSVSGEGRDDLMWQMMNIFAFPMAYFNDKKDYDLEFFNKYILYGVNALLSSYHVAKNETYFLSVLNWIKKEKLENIYIFGRGEVGISLKNYLINQDITINSFIDDNVNSEDCISFNDFNKKFQKDITSKGIIIASYKCQVEREIMKQIAQSKVGYLKIISLFELTLEAK
jgi:glycosyltransferase involved in cell wall biosynthesis